MDKKINGLPSRVWQPTERASTPKRKSEGTPAELKEFEDRIRNMVSVTHSKLDERLQELTVELKQLQTDVHEQHAKLELDQLGFRKLCNEVAHDVTNELERAESRIPRPTLSQTRGSRAYSAERQDHAHQGLLERMEFIRYKVKTEMSLLRTQYQNELQRIAQSVSDMESKMNSWNRGNGEQTSELESVIAAEIKTRRSNEVQLNRRITLAEDRVESLSKAVRDSVAQANRIPTPVTMVSRCCHSSGQ
ncbi:hypothetical protein FBUS_02459 [Fasciolopsis buskii]|uniref:Uncharacterized protein n=1 Tax=Fasciolopsis buskii TaxID=27845 RepID=A0A8E0S4L7_9TREM|nr:hypothetical protein FBUS_02459 [Fasciolopsis buski]